MFFATVYQKMENFRRMLKLWSVLRMNVINVKEMRRVEEQFKHVKALLNENYWMHTKANNFRQVEVNGTIVGMQYSVLYVSSRFLQRSFALLLAIALFSLILIASLCLHPYKILEWRVEWYHLNHHFPC